MDAESGDAYIATMQYTPLTIANTFLDVHGRASRIEHMKLQKLAYYAYGWWLGYRDEPIMTEQPELWQYGPVFDSLYSTMKQYGSQPIPQPQPPNPFMSAPVVPPGDVETRNFLNWIWARYGGLSGLTLSDETHKVGTPWQVEAQKFNYRVPRHYKIPIETIREYFRAEAAKLAAA